MSIRPSRLIVFAILTVFLLGLEAKPLQETFDASEDFNLNEAPRHLMEEKRNKVSLSTGTLQKLMGPNLCPPNRYNLKYC